MKASLQIGITGYGTEGCAHVDATVLIPTENGEYRHLKVYSGMLPAEDLPETMPVEQWALIAISAHVEVIKATIATKISRGPVTLPSQVPIPLRLLRLGAWPALSRRPE